MDKQFDWRDIASESRKARLIYDTFNFFFGDERETRLIYEVGDVDGLTSMEVQELAREFLRGCQPTFAVLEFTPSQNIPGQPMLLHIEGMLVVHPSFLLRERRCHLLQVGLCTTPGDEFGKGQCINFHKEWKRDRM